MPHCESQLQALASDLTHAAGEFFRLRGNRQSRCPRHQSQQFRATRARKKGSRGHSSATQGEGKDKINDEVDRLSQALAGIEQQLMFLKENRKIELQRAKEVLKLEDAIRDLEKPKVALAALVKAD